MKDTIVSLLTLAALSFPGCNSSTPENGTDTAYVADIQAWHQNRIERLKSEDGWLNLAGLYWLEQGNHTFGSDPSNDIVFPEGKAAKFLGTFLRKDSVVSVRINSNVDVTCNGERIREAPIFDGSQENRTVLKHRTLSWFVIERGSRLAIRLRDLDNPALANFKGIEMYPIDSKWNVKAQLKPYEPPKTISVPTVLGTIREQPSPGRLEFKIDDHRYSLDAISEESDGRLFIIFADKTTGGETYGGGRFLYADKLDGEEQTYSLDFNKAYNPPCAFSAFSTCPLPPDQNKLPVAITAGEKKYDHE